MSSKPISSEKLSDTLMLSLYPQTSGHRGYWLWDETRAMNLAMRRPTRESALIEAIHYFQKRLLDEERQHSELRAKVDSFLAQFREDDDETVNS